MQAEKIELKLGVNVKIIFHWIMVVPVIILLILNISINTFAFSILLTFFILTLGLNRTSYLRLNHERLIIIEKNFLILKTFEKSINFNDINALTIKDNGPDIISADPVSGGYGDTILKLLTGYIFYSPGCCIQAVYKSGNREEVWVNTQKGEMNKLIKRLQTMPNLDNVLTHNHNH